MYTYYICDHDNQLTINNVTMNDVTMDEVTTVTICIKTIR